MKSQYIKYLTASLIICIVFTACSKRYEDGPCVSLIKPENRVAGLWKIDKLFIDGVEQTSVSANDTLAICTFSIYRNTDNAMFVSLLDSSDLVLAESLIIFNERVTTLLFGLSTILGYEYRTVPIFRAVPALSSEQKWTITRLKRKEMWIKTEYSGAEHELRFSLVLDYDNL